MLHRRVIDCTLHKGDLLLCDCIRYLLIGQITDSHTIQIHCPDAVIIGTVSAGAAGKQMPFLVSVSSFYMSADRASLTGILRIYVDDHTVISSRLILQLLLKVIKAPTDRHVAVFSLDSLRNMSDSSQVFQNEQRVLRVIFNECLRYTMVHISRCPIAFSLLLEEGVPRC